MIFPSLFRKIKKGIGRKYKDIDPEDIFLDSENLPGFAEHRFEGRMEEPISGQTFVLLEILLIFITLVFVGKLFSLQVIHGENLAKISENNRLSHTLIFANRGLVYDRNKLELAWNAVKADDTEFASRIYANMNGLAHVVGYLKYPSKDSAGFYYEEDYRGQSGIERVYNDSLRGTNGLKISETDALGNLVSESVTDLPKDGNDLVLSIDARLSQELYNAMRSIAEERGFSGGAGVIMDVETGEILALASFPEYDQNVVTTGKDKKEIQKLFTSEKKPFLNRVVSGLYTPGSIVKPIVALGALSEGVINPEKKILSTGALTVPNPYDKSKPSVFKDWKAHGWVDMRDALAVSSDVYFYEVGGGFGDQKGLGISNIDKYFTLFGLAEKTGIDLPSESVGFIATPEWKKLNFNGDDWRLGDTYITAIGQYGTQITPIDAVRWTAAIANGGRLLVPSVILGGTKNNIFRTINLPEEDWKVVREGMRQGVTSGIVSALYTPAVAVASKTGTAELGVSKQQVNSWNTGFFPYEQPRYAFAVVMERGPVANIVGATYVMQRVINWMIINTPEYLK
ncbi:MAG: penicillin-binding transpeptidase domain-containing protein [Minisyncoccota bacterium]